METWKLLLITFLSAIVLGCIVGVITGKYQLNKARSGRKALLSVREKVVYLVCFALGVGCILFGILYKFPSSSGMIDEGMMDPGMMEDGMMDGGAMVNPDTAGGEINPDFGGGDAVDEDAGLDENMETDETGDSDGGDEADGDGEEANENTDSTENTGTQTQPAPAPSGGGTIVYRESGGTAVAIPVG